MTEDLVVREIAVGAVGRDCGTLERETQFAFTYADGINATEAVSITMPVRRRSYVRGALFPIFEMNLPEGFVRWYLSERLRKHALVDDMLFLALARDLGIGRLSYRAVGVEHEPLEPLTLAELLSTNRSGLFTELVDRYLIRTTAGVSGVQPKVVVPERRGSLTLPSLIVKTGRDEYPGLAVNEFVCMSIARKAGLATPQFWLSEDRSLFVMRRFDLGAEGERLGMEDFAVLMARPGEKKYRGKVETLLRAARLFGVDTSELFDQVALSMLVGNGDAHLKNYAVLYRDPTQPTWLSPLYDVVCTRAYGDQTLALSLGGSRTFPSRVQLEKLGRQFDVIGPAERIDRIADAVSAGLGELSDLLVDHPDITRWIDRSRSRATTKRPLRTH